MFSHKETEAQRSVSTCPGSLEPGVLAKGQGFKVGAFNRAAWMWAFSHPLLTSWMAISGTQGQPGSHLATFPQPQPSPARGAAVDHQGWRPSQLGRGLCTCMGREGIQRGGGRGGCGHQSSLGHSPLSTSRASLITQVRSGLRWGAPGVTPHPTSS